MTITNRQIRALLAALGLVLALPVSADAAAGNGSYCDTDHAGRLGWHFYCEPEKEKEPEAAPPPPPPTPAEQLEAFEQELEDARATAVMEPTVANIIEYRRLHQRSLDMASHFADQWQRVTWQEPEFDYTLQRPVSQVGKTAWLDERRASQTAAVTNIGERYGVFFFYLSTCPFCHRYSPILKDFAARHGIHVQAVSLDGGPLPGWPDAIVDQGQWNSWGLKGNPVPATILYDMKTNRVVPVGFGLMAQSELTNRIFMLTTKEVGDDF